LKNQIFQITEQTERGKKYLISIARHTADIKYYIVTTYL